jgi:head-tail adaptor
MADVRSAEPLRDKLYLQSRSLVDDGFGNLVPGGEFETQHEVFANLKPLRGTESVMASRLAGTQPYIITMRASSETRQVNVAWRIVDKNNPDRIFAISAPPTEPERGWLEILATEGEPS